MTAATPDTSPTAGCAEADDTPTAHGACVLDGLSIDSYSLELKHPDGWLGDQASQGAFRELLDQWRERLEHAGRDPLGPTPTEDLDKEALDAIARSGATPAARTVALAIGEFAGRLQYVIEQFLQQQAWRGVSHIAIGGGFKESLVGRIAIRQTAQRLAEAGVNVVLQPIAHAADDAGLIGWAELMPPLARRVVASTGTMPAILAVDIGGTNVRCGIVGFDPAGSLDSAHVVHREKWCHDADGPAQAELVDGIVEMLQKLEAHARQQHITLAPFIGVACPGIICADGSIDRGAQNLPGDWHGDAFHLPRSLCERLPTLGGESTVVRMHNDAVVQGLSEWPRLRHVPHWAVLTIGTGLGNASFSTRPPGAPAPGRRGCAAA